MCLALSLAACVAEPGAGDASGEAGTAAAPAVRALEIAEAYVRGYFEQFPEEAYEAGYPDAPQDRLSDRSPPALSAWHAREDAWLAELRALDSAAVAAGGAGVPYAYALDRLEAAVGLRVCRLALWNVSPTWTGWPELLPSVFAEQPVGSETARDVALARAGDVPRFLDTEVANLREGVRLGYAASLPAVDAVLRQVDDLLALPVAESPFLAPAARDEDPAFGRALRALVVDSIRPAVRRYRAYLAEEYRPAARLQVGVAANPDGEACYRASVRHFTTLPLSPREIHETGLRQMERIQAEMRAIAERSFGTDDVPALLQRVGEDPRFTFRDAEGILAYAGAAVRRARAAVPRWFGTVPEAEVVVRPYPAFQKRTGGGFYTAGTGDRPGVYLLGTHDPTSLSRAGLEATTFHETWPGHHMQVNVALERGALHPVLKYFFNSGMGEGWALYAERLADEMGLYSGDVDRLGLLSNEALRAARLVVDPGMHALGWSRERAVRYMREHTAESPSSVAYEVDRYLAVPGQATSYMVGSLEILRLREEARRRLGDRFDIRAFHDLVLQDGTVSLPMLQAKVERWTAEPASP